MVGYSQLRWFVRIIVKLFFRKVDVVGQTRIPESGATIFVANHANQFVDPMMLIKLIPRPVRFLIAAKSLKRRIIGDFARAARAVGVMRPQDLAFKGAGTVSRHSATTITGEGTTFIKDLGAGSKLKMGDIEVAVKSVESDTSCTVSECTETFTKASYKILPKVDQNAVYSEVHNALRIGDCIGIFPEGGSHDRTQMLDLKPGVAIMALGALNSGVTDIKIVPCGLNYFEPYKFRSRVVVEFGEPILVPAELGEQYKTDKRGAVASLMDRIEQGMKRVLPEAEDYEKMKVILIARALWKPHDRKVTAEEMLKITKAFALGLRKFQDDDRVTALSQQIVNYSDALQVCGVKDRDVRHNLTKTSVLRKRVVQSAVTVILLFPFAFVIALLFTPVAAVTYMAAKQEKVTALAGSTVKVKALDVVASQKIKVGLVVVPLYSVLLSILIVFFAGLQWLWFFVLLLIVFPLCVAVGVHISDKFAKELWHCKTNWRLRNYCEALFDQRVEMQLKVRKLVEELAPQVIENWDQRRVITREEIENDSSLQMPLLASQDRM